MHTVTLREFYCIKPLYRPVAWGGIMISTEAPSYVSRNQCWIEIAPNSTIQCDFFELKTHKKCICSLGDARLHWGSLEHSPTATQINWGCLEVESNRPLEKSDYEPALWHLIESYKSHTLSIHRRNTAECRGLCKTKWNKTTCFSFSFFAESYPG